MLFDFLILFAVGFCFVFFFCFCVGDYLFLMVVFPVQIAPHLIFALLSLDTHGRNYFPPTVGARGTRVRVGATLFSRAALPFLGRYRVLSSLLLYGWFGFIVSTDFRTSSRADLHHTAGCGPGSTLMHNSRCSNNFALPSR